MATPHTANEEALKKVEDQLECSICLQPYTDPKLLPCFHVYCKHCLERIVVQDQDGSTITCPNCRQPANLPEDGVAALQSAFHINHLFDIRETLEKAKKPEKTQCEKCKVATTTGFCRDRGKFVCESCTKIHQEWDELANHQIVGLADIQAETASLVPTTAKVLCAKQKPKFCCGTRQELVNNDSTLHLHEDHQYDLAADTLPKHREEIQAHLEPVRQQFEMVNEALRDLETRTKEIGEQRLSIEANIDKQVNQLRQAHDQRRAELVGHLDQLTQQKLKSLAAQKDQIETLQTHISSCLEYVETRLKTGTESEILAMKASVVEQIHQITAKINLDTLHPREMANMLLVADDAPRLTEACHKFAAVTTIDPNQCYTTGSGLNSATAGEQAEVTLHAKDKQGRGTALQAADIDITLVCCETGTAVKCIAEEAREGEYRIRYQATTCGKKKLHITLGGRQTRGSPHGIVVRQRLQDLQKPVKVLAKFKSPIGITTNSKERIIVIEGGAHCVTVLTADGEKLQSFGGEGTRRGQFTYPFGVTVDTEDNIYVVDCSNNSVQKFTPKGEHVSSVGCRGSNQLEFKGPYNITFNPRDGKLYVCDRGNDRIQILDTNLSLRGTISNKEGGEEKLSNPQDIAFDSDGNIYIASGQHIQVFTPEGQYLREFGSRGTGPGQLQDAEGITINRDRIYT